MANKTNSIQVINIANLFHTQQGKWKFRNEAKDNLLINNMKRNIKTDKKIYWQKSYWKQSFESFPVMCPWSNCYLRLLTH